MQIEADAVIPFPRESVFRTYRDDLPALIEFLPHVRRIEPVHREDLEGSIETRHTWHGGGDIPVPVQRALGGATFRWEEQALWSEKDWSCAWSIETGVFRDAVQCAGRHTFVALGERTRLEIKGSMSIDLGAIKALPSFLADGLAHTVEHLVSRQITANLLSVSDALARYLDSHTI
jgi:hypothetical protein